MGTNKNKNKNKDKPKKKKKNSWGRGTRRRVNYKKYK
jgi:hypothetical protein